MIHENTEHTEKLYEQEKEQLVKDNVSTKRIIKINEYLQQFNWATIHPYLFGFQVDYLENLMTENKGTSEEVFKLFAASFFELKSTAAFIEGSIKKRPYLSPFCHLIDQSVFMCLQRDYAGAINTLLPVIEGSIRNYLIQNKGFRRETPINKDKMIMAFDYIKNDYYNRQLKVYEKKYCNYYGVTFNQEQILNLTKIHSETLNIWFEVLGNYFKKNLYSNTDNLIEDKLNRHIIFHGFNADIYYSLENYIRLYNCINFLSYALVFADPDGHVLLNYETKDVLRKWKAFEKVKAISKLTTKIKSSVYTEYPEFDKAEFEKEFMLDDIDKIIIKKRVTKVEKTLTLIDKLFKHVSIS